MGFLDFLLRRKKAPPPVQLSHSSPDRTMMGFSLQGAPPPDASTQMGIVVPPSAAAAPPTAAAPSTIPAPPSEAATAMIVPPKPAAPEETARTRQIVVPPQPKARLARKSGGSGGPWDLLPREYEIGRSSSADIVIPDPSVSGHHCKLVPHGDGFAIRDLGSTNGTKVNGKAISGDHGLRGGETITLGEVTLGYERI